MYNFEEKYQPDHSVLKSSEYSTNTFKHELVLKREKVIYLGSALVA